MATVTIADGTFSLVRVGGGEIAEGAKGETTEREFRVEFSFPNPNRRAVEFAVCMTGGWASACGQRGLPDYEVVRNGGAVVGTTCFPDSITFGGQRVVHKVRVIGDRIPA